MTYSGKSSIYCPLKFDGLNFPTWKVKMTVFLNFLGGRVAKAIAKPFVCPEVMRTCGPKLLLRNIMPIPRPVMRYFKL